MVVVEQCPRWKGRQHKAVRYIAGTFTPDYKCPESVSLVIGMHPDEATGEIIRYAVKHRLKFVVCPCCRKDRASLFISVTEIRNQTAIQNVKTTGVKMTGSRPLTESEIQKLLQAFKGKYSLRNRTLFLLGLNTGARISELLALNVGDVWRFGRPVEIIYLHKRHTKGKLVGRQITIRSGAQQAIFDLIQWKKQQPESKPLDAPLFVSRQGGRLKRKQAHNIFTDAFNACELSGHVSTHSWRKTFANHVLRASGGNIKVLQELLGHQHLSTTEAYLSFDLDELRSAVPDFGLSPGPDDELDLWHLSSNSSKVIPFQTPINTKTEAKRRN